MVKDEVEPLGGFIGDAFVQPALLGGQALTALVFIMVQNFWLGAIAVGIVAVQVVIIPRMRRRLIRLGRERQLTARELSGRVGEIVDGIGTIHVHDTSNYERADIAARLGRIFKIRYDLYQWKFLVKFINNFLAQVTPFLFYFDRRLSGAQGQSRRRPARRRHRRLQGPAGTDEGPDRLGSGAAGRAGQIRSRWSSSSPSTAHRSEDPDDRDRAGRPDHRARLARSICRSPTTAGRGCWSGSRCRSSRRDGRAGRHGGRRRGSACRGLRAADLARERQAGRSASTTCCELPESVTGRRISYASSDAFFFQGTLARQSALRAEACAAEPGQAYEGAGSHSALGDRRGAAAGNPDFDIRSDWIDYEAAGATGPDDLFTAIRPVLDAVHAVAATFSISALRSSIDPERHPDLVAPIVRTARGAAGAAGDTKI